MLKLPKPSVLEMPPRVILELPPPVALNLPPNSLLEPQIHIEPHALKTDVVYRDDESTKMKMTQLLRRESAAEFVGPIKPQMHLFGVTRGQFSLIDVVRHITQDLRPWSITVFTWTIAIKHLEQLRQLLADGRIDAARFVLDVSYIRREPESLDQIRKIFGTRNMIITKIHAKFLLLRHAEFRIAIRTSMNLNYNARIEDIDIKDDARLYDFLEGIVSEIFEKHDIEKQITGDRKATESEIRGHFGPTKSG